jgi:hypothetical protein
MPSATVRRPRFLLRVTMAEATSDGWPPLPMAETNERSILMMSIGNRSR